MQWGESQAPPLWIAVAAWLADCCQFLIVDHLPSELFAYDFQCACCGLNLAIIGKEAFPI
jgi:hypothetical protein